MELSEENDEIKDIEAPVSEPIEEDEEYDFSSTYENDDIEGYTIPEGDYFDAPIYPDVEKAVDKQENEETSKTGNVEEILKYISKNFRDFCLDIENKDIAFDGIMLTATPSVENGKLIFKFDNKSNFELAVSGQYDEVIKDAIYNIYDIDVLVILKDPNGEEYVKISSEIEEDEKDPLEDLFKLAEQNQIIFKLED